MLIFFKKKTQKLILRGRKSEKRDQEGEEGIWILGCSAPLRSRGVLSGTILGGTQRLKTRMS